MNVSVEVLFFLVSDDDCEYGAKLYHLRSSVLTKNSVLSSPPFNSSQRRAFRFSLPLSRYLSHFSGFHRSDIDISFKLKFLQSSFKMSTIPSIHLCLYDQQSRFVNSLVSTLSLFFSNLPPNPDTLPFKALYNILYNYSSSRYFSYFSFRLVTSFRYRSHCQCHLSFSQVL